MVCNIFINAIIVLMCYQLSNAKDVGVYLDIGSGTFKSALSKGFHPGGSIVVNGTVYPNATRFDINLEDDSVDSIVYLHISARFGEKKLLFSNKDPDFSDNNNDNWSPGYVPFSRNLSGLSLGDNFQLTLFCNATGYMININKKPVFFFGHRFDTSRIRYIKFKDSVTINSVLYIPGNQTCQMEGCGENEECVFEYDQFQCQCIDGYSGPLCQDTCRTTGCTENKLCVYSNKKHACRSPIELAGQANSNINCREPYVAVDSECVWVVKSKLNWDAARYRCQEGGGFLMEPDFPIKFKQYMSDNYPDNGRVRSFWIGGTDRGLGRWVWATSLTDLQEDFPWGPNEPNEDSHGVKEDCISLVQYSNNKPGFYNDDKCHQDTNYICESHPLVTPTAAARVEEIGQMHKDSEMQIAILVLLVITMISGAGILIYNNFNVVKKDYYTDTHL